MPFSDYVLHVLYVKLLKMSGLKKWEEQQVLQASENMLQKLKNSIAQIRPNSLKITVSWIVNDVNRFGEIDDLVIYGDVGFRKTKWIKTGISFKVTKELKKEMSLIH